MAKIKRTLSSSLRSFSYTNFLVNGDCVDTTGWNVISGSIATANNTLTSTADGVNAYNVVYNETSIQAVVGDVIYIKLLLGVTNTDNPQMTINIKNTAGNPLSADFIRFNAGIQNKLYETSGLINIQFSGSVLRFYAEQTYSDAATANGKEMQLQKVLMVNLTDMYGAGNEPLVADCDNIFRFVDGTVQPNFSKSLAIL